MYKLLIVDDLPLVRTGIVKMLEKEHLPLAQVSEAINGLDALEFIGHNRPDIVITDIRMPVMDGIELIRRSKKQYKNVKFIVISGYAEFEYAKEALAAGVIAYVLKPANSKELAGAIRIACDDIARTTAVEHELAAKKVLEREKAEQELRLFLKNLIFSGAYRQESELMLVPPYPEWKAACFAIIVFHMSRPAAQPAAAADRSYRAAVLQAETVIQELCGENGSSLLALRNPRDEAEIVVLCSGRDEHDMIHSGMSFARHCLAKMRPSPHVAVTAGIGNSCGDLSQLGNGYREAREAVIQRFAGGSGKVYSFPYDVLRYRSTYAYPEQEVQTFEICLKHSGAHHSPKSMRMMLNDLFPQHHMQGISEPDLKSLFERTIHAVLDYYKLGDSRCVDALSQFARDRSMISGFADVADIADYMMTLIERLQESAPSGYSDTKQLVLGIEKHIRSQFHETMNLQTIAERHHIDFKYLSKVFKTVTGRHFNEYVTQVRLERAKELLAKTPMGIQDIAKSVGYSDHHYFHQVFKKLTGMTPNEYRTMHMQE